MNKSYQLKIYNLKWNDITQNYQNDINECSICLETLNKNIISTNCKHKFHIKCLKKWTNISNSCPCCR
jgi:hypothetical protein